MQYIVQIYKYVGILTTGLLVSYGKCINVKYYYYYKFL